MKLLKLSLILFIPQAIIDKLMTKNSNKKVNIIINIMCNLCVYFVRTYI